MKREKKREGREEERGRKGREIDRNGNFLLYAVVRVTRSCHLHMSDCQDHTSQSCQAFVDLLRPCDNATFEP